MGRDEVEWIGPKLSPYHFLTAASFLFYIIYFFIFFKIYFILFFTRANISAIY